MPTTEYKNGWNEHAYHVLEALEENKSEHKEIRENNKCEHKEINDKLTTLITQMAVSESRMSQKARNIALMSGGGISLFIGIILWLITRQPSL